MLLDSFYKSNTLLRILIEEPFFLVNKWVVFILQEKNYIDIQLTGFQLSDLSLEPVIQLLRF